MRTLPGRERGRFIREWNAKLNREVIGMQPSIRNSENPYQSPHGEPTALTKPLSPSTWWLMLVGGASSLLFSFPVAGILALFFRFPIPIAGYQSGHLAIVPAMFAVIIYGLLGGFPLLVALGALSAFIISKSNQIAQKSKFMMVVFASLTVSFCCLFFLAVLDFIIGPW